MTDQKTISIVAGIFLMMFLSLSFASAVSSGSISVSFPDPAIVNLNPTNPTQIVEFLNGNLSEAPTVSLTLSANLGSVAQLSASSLVVPSRNSITISIKSGAINGSYSGTLDYSYPSGSGSIPVSIFIPTTTPPVNPSDIIVFPTSKIITVQQGAEKTQNILISVPGSYPRTVTINAVNFNPGTDPISFGDLNLGQIPPGQSIQIPIVFSGKEAQTGTYQTDLSILATDSEGQIQLPKISLVLQVTQGVTPVDQTTFSTPPTCSLSATTLSLNQSYSFTCSNANSNIAIEPQYSDYFEGQKVQLPSGSGLYKYDFRPLRTGNTHFIAVFKYQGNPIFQAYDSEVRITSGGSVVSGTTMGFLFTPTLEMATGTQSVLIQIVDNKTGSLVDSPRLFINALEQNSSSVTFSYNFLPDQDYELRAKANGYDDYVQTIKLSPKNIDVTISPSGGDVTTVFNISTSIANATLKINDLPVSNPYLGTLTPGLNKIEASKTGYITKSLNITVSNSITILSGPSAEEFKKGKNTTLTLNKNATSWVVWYLPKLDSTDRQNYATGVGNTISFIPKKSGVYTVEADGFTLTTYEAKGFSFTNKWWIFPVWAWLIIAIVVIILLVIIIAVASGGGSNEDDTSGLSYQVGSG
ncbi:MAG: hypothetical protein NT076_03800 [Candidatus Pacearchaeota archaeon]|nr:hypothetical protein [Candidatus Pacearchaeota archaeon]